MDNFRSWNLLDEALGLDQRSDGDWPLRGKVVLIEDCVDTSAAFVLHHLVKRCLSPQPPSGPKALLFISFSHPFSHYDRVLRKLGCNLVSHRDNKRFFFFDVLNVRFPDGNDEKTGRDALVCLFDKIHDAVASLSAEMSCITIMIDDISLMEVVADGSSNNVLNFLHYCHTLTSEFDCSLVALNHEDIYSSRGSPKLMLNLEYISDILVRAEPLATGSAVDVHGQLMVLNKGDSDEQRSSRSKTHNFHFQIKENSVEYFYPGSRS